MSTATGTSDRRRILPGARVGVLGSGQLGRMLAIAARQMGYRVHTFSPERGTPTGQVADREIVAPYDDLDAVRAFAREVEIVTFEFENIAHAAALAAAECAPVRPHGAVLHTTQHRLREKTFLTGIGVPVAPFEAVHSAAELSAALPRIGCPAVLKSAGWGYDGKGQVRIDDPARADEAWQHVGADEAVLEGFVEFECELSLVVARGLDGTVDDWGLVANEHRDHVLDVSTAPAGVASATLARAREIARAIVESLDVVGVLCVEFFAKSGGELLVNELAPRPHNSGHFTIDAAVTSQFEQQLRAVCGLPLGSCALLRPAAMANLLGDVWQHGEPSWARALAQPQVKLHLYGKGEARAGRKMGHLTALADSPAAARSTVLAARDALRPTPRG